MKILKEMLFAGILMIWSPGDDMTDDTRVLVFENAHASMLKGQNEGEVSYAPTSSDVIAESSGRTRRNSNSVFRYRFASKVMSIERENKDFNKLERGERP